MSTLLWDGACLYSTKTLYFVHNTIYLSWKVNPSFSTTEYKLKVNKANYCCDSRLEFFMIYLIADV